MTRLHTYIVQYIVQRKLMISAGLCSLLACQSDPEVMTVKFSALPVEERLRAYKVPGVSIAIIRDFRVAALVSYGCRDARTGEPVGHATLFQAASISKPVASAAALRKVEEGTLALDADINAALRSWQVPGSPYTVAQPVTLKHLLGHTGGITVSGFPGYPSGAAVPDLVQILNGARPANNTPIGVNAVPGTAFRYSGGGYCVVQQALIDATQQDFATIVQETVLGPLQMTGSSFAAPGPDRDAATGHHRNGKTVPGRWNAYPEMAAAGLWSTAEDLARFAIGLQLGAAGKPGGVLSPEMTRLMLTPGADEAYGLGVYLHQKGGNAYFSHSGLTVGYQCRLVAHRDKGYGAVVMTNSDNGLKLADEILRSISLEYHWEDYPL